jgi:hypothetical protein
MLVRYYVSAERLERSERGPCSVLVGMVLVSSFKAQFVDRGRPGARCPSSNHWRRNIGRHCTTTFKHHAHPHHHQNAFHRANNAAAPGETKPRRRRRSCLKLRFGRQAAQSGRPSTSARRNLTPAHRWTVATAKSRVAIKQRRERRGACTSARLTARARCRPSSTACTARRTPAKPTRR